ncbi:helix-turn-helix transcriptional regulator [Planomicrobium chinense]|uniref:helix-turn-helix domain-containing protein n=1 Tax=Planococcus chinensis TaxID=272917 RepID=UPI001CC4986F|nr:helix-turn-helix transcriptional regulator [Planococcus chinensis]MBZ5203239.1 helix-turn-helix transcriptional regulator [Planococcus chinensis]
MDKRAEIVKELIDKNWKSRRAFALEIGIAPSTLSSMLERGIGNASVDSVIKVCAGLGITTDQLQRMAEGEEVGSRGIETIAAHIDEDVTEEEIEEIKKYIDFIKSQRKN